MPGADLDARRDVDGPRAARAGSPRQRWPAFKPPARMTGRRAASAAALRPVGHLSRAAPAHAIGCIDERRDIVTATPRPVRRQSSDSSVTALISRACSAA